MDELRKRIKDIVSEQLGFYRYDENASIADLDVDSLTTQEIVLALEDEFGIKLDIELIQETTRISEIIDWMYQALCAHRSK